ncbi:glycosyltransferase family 2 protein [Hoylesella timonensis]|uniref:Glycosyltransferase, group 2 family protein n=1 Tax=Hoylesella timonensis CRIS 5C-B1 TaxID=679189 RepID=D1VYV2_9BACT|nr:glycosyltransferase family 2 protein [Hoylesella timonensis]EFA97631.1 glycosyltransferase, group 2 family protein [Hoylesella timonensis CRIS 5C-B1]
MIKFTIITCTYQAEKELERTLRSVLEQTYKDVEHLIVDGASTDATLQLAQTYSTESQAQNNGHQVMVTSEPDKGLYDAMNKGLRHATGDYVLFLNAGDTFPSESTLTQVAACAERASVLPGVLYGDTDIVDNEGKFVRHRRLSPPKKLSWKSFMQGMVVCHQAFYARTDLAKQVPYQLKYRYSADVDWCIRVMKMAQKQGLPLCNVQIVVANYLDGGMTEKNHKASLKERFRVMESHYGYLPTLFMHAWFAVRSVLKK